MSRLIETIRLQNGRFFNLSYHERRMRHALRSLFGEDGRLDLENFLCAFDYPKTGLLKCRIVYDAYKKDVTFTSYQLRKISSLKLVTDNNITYAFKFEDRSAIDNLFSQKENCDDVLIVKNGFVTDTSMANILFKKGNKWFTPRSCLLKGTVRQRLLDEGKIIEQDISPADIYSFEAFQLISSMLQADSDEMAVQGILS